MQRRWCLLLQVCPGAGGMNLRGKQVCHNFLSAIDRIIAQKPDVLVQAGGLITAFKRTFFAHEIICTPLMPLNPDEEHEEMAREHR